TTYSYYYEFANGFNSMRSATKTFKTEAGGSGGGDEPPTPSEITLPTVITAEVSEITTNSAQCGGEVTNDGGAEVTERGICWSTNANPSLNDNHIASGTGTGAFTTMMDSLAASTTYHVRAYATNEKGTAYGLDREFVTASIVVLPTVTTADVSGITSNSAQCGGEVTNDGGAEVTERGICWSTNENPNLSDSHIAVGSGTGTFNYSINGLTANTTYHVRAYAANSVGTAYGLDEAFTTLSGGGGEHEYVDLGLPSGTLWATSDIDYVAWGETGGNCGFYVSSYSYCFGGYNMLTKYCNNPNYGYNGFVDNLTVLEPMDDAATVLWGDDWHTPTKEQWQELIDNTINNWTLQDGAYGWIFTANNGRSLFFEAAGMAIDGGFGYIGSEGYYWSSSLYTNDPSLAWCLGFSSGGCYVGGEWRAIGLLVRPVRSSTK
ncbi:MAG: hypothetical protein J6P73_02510, partial [Bacteroidales bacterium]|nr:hypothetical protein [Bacteroidales bacterium]